MKIRPFEFLSALFFPPACLACHKHLAAGALCDSCRTGIQTTSTLFCGECRLPVQAQSVQAARSQALAAAPCHPEFPYLLGAPAVYKKSTAVKALVHELKFRGIREAARPLAEILTQYVIQLGILSAATKPLIIPIPLSDVRRRERGFNQAELIGRFLATAINVPIALDILTRPKHAKPQSETATLAARLENIRGCFAIQNEAALADRSIILVDDVVTSGATFLEAAHILQPAGANRILALAVAQA